MPQNIFLPQGFLPVNSVKLCSFIANRDNPLDPMHDPEIEIDLEKDVVVSPYSNYGGNQQAGSGQKLGASLPSLLSASITKTTNGSTTVNTTGAITYQLRNSEPLFKKAIQNRATRLWIEDQSDSDRKHLLFLVGYHAMVDAVIVLGDKNESEVSGQARIAISKALAAAGILLPDGVFTDPEISAKIEKSRASTIEFVATGERVCAFQYRKVKFRWFSGKDIDRATLSDQSWHTVKIPRGVSAGAAEGDVIEVELVDDDDRDNEKDEDEDGSAGDRQGDL
jgi:hypothetical protein